MMELLCPTPHKCYRRLLRAFRRDFRFDEFLWSRRTQHVNPSSSDLPPPNGSQTSDAQLYQPLLVAVPATAHGVSSSAGRKTTTYDESLWFKYNLRKHFFLPLAAIRGSRTGACHSAAAFEGTEPSKQTAESRCASADARQLSGRPLTEPLTYTSHSHLLNAAEAFTEYRQAVRAFQDILDCHGLQRNSSSSKPLEARERIQRAAHLVGLDLPAQQTLEGEPIRDFGIRSRLREKTDESSTKEGETNDTTRLR